MSYTCVIWWALLFVQKCPSSIVPVYIYLRATGPSHHSHSHRNYQRHQHWLSWTQVTREEIGLNIWKYLHISPPPNLPLWVASRQNNLVLDCDSFEEGQLFSMQMPCSEAKLDHLDTEVHVTIQYRVSFYRCIGSICKINLFNCRECSEIQTNSLQRGNFTLSSEKSCLMQKTLPEAQRTQGIDSLT